jgi:uncharacterized protein (DUF2126 family)
MSAGSRAAALSRAGKWYPGEELPRWALSCWFRKDGMPLWHDASLFAQSDHDYGHDAALAERFALLCDRKTTGSHATA